MCGKAARTVRRSGKWKQAARSRYRSACKEVRGQRRIYTAAAPSFDPTDRGLLAKLRPW